MEYRMIKCDSCGKEKKAGEEPLWFTVHREYPANPNPGTIQFAIVADIVYMNVCSGTCAMNAMKMVKNGNP